jgi:murein DD-endopeptidase MepM/ murein hydrolase activator NlpD
MAPVGHPVLAAADGTVIIATVRLADGGLIMIDHGPWDDIRHLYTFYAHLSRLDVRAGARVRRGDVIGAVGRTGSLAGQLPHLHFETRTTVGPGSVRTLGGEPFLWGRGRRTEDPANFWLLEGQRIAPFRPGAPVPEGARGLTYPVAC